MPKPQTYYIWKTKRIIERLESGIPKLHVKEVRGPTTAFGTYFSALFITGTRVGLAGSLGSHLDTFISTSALSGLDGLAIVDTAVNRLVLERRVRAGRKIEHVAANSSRTRAGARIMIERVSLAALTRREGFNGNRDISCVTALILGVCFQAAFFRELLATRLCLDIVKEMKDLLVIKATFLDSNVIGIAIDLQYDTYKSTFLAVTVEETLAVFGSIRASSGLAHFNLLGYFSLACTVIQCIHVETT